MTPVSAEQLQAEGLQLFQQKQYDAALDRFQTAVPLFAAQANDHGRGELLNNIGVIQRLKKNPQAAIAALQEAAHLFSRLNAPHQLAQTLANLGDLHAQTRQQEEAARCYSQAAQLFAQLNDRHKQSQVLRACSLMRLRQGQWLQSFVYMEKSLAVRPSPGLFGWLFRALLRFALSLFKLDRL